MAHLSVQPSGGLGETRARLPPRNKLLDKSIDSHSPTSNTSDEAHSVAHSFLSGGTGGRRGSLGSVNSLHNRSFWEVESSTSDSDSDSSSSSASSVAAYEVPPLYGRTLFLFSARSALRHSLSVCLHHPYVNYAILFLVVVDAVALALGSPLLEEDSPINKFVYYESIVVGAIFTLELACRAVTVGVFTQKEWGDYCCKKEEQRGPAIAVEGVDMPVVWLSNSTRYSDYSSSGGSGAYSSLYTTETYSADESESFLDSEDLDKLLPGTASHRYAAALRAQENNNNNNNSNNNNGVHSSGGGGRGGANMAATADANQPRGPKRKRRRRRVQPRGTHPIFQDGWLILDFVVVASFAVSLFAGSEFFAVRVLRQWRVLRPLRALAKSKNLRAIISTLSQSFAALLNVMLFIGFFFVVYGIIGIQMFGGSMERQCVLLGTQEVVEPALYCGFAETAYHCPSNMECVELAEPGEPWYGLLSFNNIAQAFLTIFTMVTLEGWVDVMYAVMDSEHWIASFYFVSLIILVSFLVMNLFVAVVSDTFLDRKVAETDRARAARIREQRKLAERGGGYVLVHTELGGHTFVSVQDEAQKASVWRCPQFEWADRVQRAVASVVDTDEFEYAVIVLIIVNALAMSMEHHGMSVQLTRALYICEIIFAVLFSLEMLLKIVSVGGVWEFFEDKGNIFDAAVVVLTVLALFSPDINSSNLAVLRVLRVFKVARIYRRVSGFQHLIHALTSSLAEMGYVLMLTAMYLGIAALLGMQLYSGQFEFEDGKPRANFDYFSDALLSMFQVLTGENWIDVMFSGLRSEAWWTAPIFFVGCFLFGGYVLLNLIVAVILESFELMDVEKKRAQLTNYLGLRYKPTIPGEAMKLIDSDSDDSESSESLPFLESLVKRFQPRPELTSVRNMPSSATANIERIHVKKFNARKSRAIRVDEVLEYDGGEAAEEEVARGRTWRDISAATSTTNSSVDGVLEGDQNSSTLEYADSFSYGEDEDDMPRTASSSAHSMVLSDGGDGGSGGSAGSGQGSGSSSSRALVDIEFEVTPPPEDVKQGTELAEPVLELSEVFLGGSGIVEDEGSGVGVHVPLDQPRRVRFHPALPPDAAGGPPSAAASVYPPHSHRLKLATPHAHHAHHGHHGGKKNSSSSSSSSSSGNSLSRGGTGNKGKGRKRRSSSSSSTSDSQRDNKSKYSWAAAITEFLSLANDNGTGDGASSEDGSSWRGEKSSNRSGNSSGDGEDSSSSSHFLGQVVDMLNRRRKRRSGREQLLFNNEYAGARILTPEQSFASFHLVKQNNRMSEERKRDLVEHAVSTHQRVVYEKHKGRVAALQTSEGVRADAGGAASVPGRRSRANSAASITGRPVGAGAGGGIVGQPLGSRRRTQRTSTGAAPDPARVGSWAAALFEPSTSESTATVTTMSAMVTSSTEYSDSYSSESPDWRSSTSTSSLESIERRLRHEYAYYDRALFCLPYHSPVRRNIKSFVRHPAFDTIILAVIVYSVVVMILDSPRYRWAQTESFQRFVFASDIAVTVIFTLEFAVKIAAYGFLFSRRAYLHSWWNRIDFFVLIIGVLNILRVFELGTVGRALRLGRALRPLRVLNRTSSMRDIVAAMGRSLAGIRNVIALVAANFVICGILGVTLFKGLLYRCNDASVAGRDECVGVYVGESGLLQPRVWSNPRFSFDNIFAATGTLFQVSTTEGFLDVMYACMDIVGLDKQPRENASASNALFFVFFIVVTTFVLVNLFIGVIVDNFNKYRNTALLTTEQRAWIDTKRAISFLRPPKQPERPLHPVRGVFWDLVTNTYFRQAVMTAIVVNVIVMATEHHNPSPSFALFIVIANYTFAGLFVLEMVLKHIGLGVYPYWSEPWNAFDGAITLGYAALLFVPEIPLSIATFRILRIARIFCLIRSAKTLEMLFRTFIISLPSVLNVSALFGLVMLIFALVGMETFGSVRHGEYLNRHANFETFPRAVLTLFRMLTGENWQGIMVDCSVQPPMCTPRDQSTDDTTDCGQSFAWIYFVMWYTFSAYIMLDLVVAVILENFSYCSNTQKHNLINNYDLKKFKRHWKRFDRDRTGYLPLGTLTLGRLRTFLFSLYIMEDCALGMNYATDAHLFGIVYHRALALSFDETRGNYQGLVGFAELLTILAWVRVDPQSLTFEERLDHERETELFSRAMACAFISRSVHRFVEKTREERRLYFYKLTTEWAADPEIESVAATSDIATESVLQESSHEDDFDTLAPLPSLNALESGDDRRNSRRPSAINITLEHVATNSEGHTPHTHTPERAWGHEYTWSKGSLSGSGGGSDGDELVRVGLPSESEEEEQIDTEFLEHLTRTDADGLLARIVHPNWLAMFRGSEVKGYDKIPAIEIGTHTSSESERDERTERALTPPKQESPAVEHDFPSNVSHCSIDDLVSANVGSDNNTPELLATRLSLLDKRDSDEESETPTRESVRESVSMQIHEVGSVSSSGDDVAVSHVRLEGESGVVGSGSGTGDSMERCVVSEGGE